VEEAQILKLRYENVFAYALHRLSSKNMLSFQLTSWVSRAAWSQIKVQGHKTARMAQQQQSFASGALLGQLQFSVSARQASGGCRIMHTNLRLETDL